MPPEASRRTATFALVAGLLLLVAGAQPLTGVAADPPPDDGDRDPVEQPDGEDRGPSADLSRAQLEDGRVTWTADPPGWGSHDFVVDEDVWNIDYWGPDGGQANLTLAVATDPDEGAHPYLQIGVWVQGADSHAILGFGLPGGPLVQTIDLEASCQQNCGEHPPTFELAVLTGARGAGTDVHVGIPAEPLPDDDERALERLAGRPDLGVAPAHRGDAGVAGTYVRVLEDGTRREQVNGAIAVDEEVPASAAGVEADRRLDVDVDRSVPAGGQASLLGGLLEHAGAQAWSLHATAGSHELHRVGATPSAPPPTPARGPVAPPAAAVMAHPGAAEVELDLEQRFTGAQGTTTVHLVSWSWASATFEDLYGWPFEPVAAATGLSTDLPAGPASAKASVCGAALAGACAPVPGR
jgi:hypothetical protein